MPYTFPTSSIAEPFVNPANPDFLSKVWRAHQSGSSNEQLNSFPTVSELTVSESAYYYKNNDSGQYK
jgi:hypothetical protein